MASIRAFLRHQPGARDEIFGHPRGLAYLFTTEMWERFSYYGMRALLVLYMVKYLFTPQRTTEIVGLTPFRHALEFVFGPLAPQPLASQIYGFYTGLVYLTPILGGLVGRPGNRPAPHGDHRRRLDGHRTFHDGFRTSVPDRARFSHSRQRCFQAEHFHAGRRPLCAWDRRRDRAFSIFYVGINLGAFLAPLVCGTLGEELGWHYGFVAAGVGMTLGLLIYLAATPHLPRDAFEKRESPAKLDTKAWRSNCRTTTVIRTSQPVLGDIRTAGQHDRALGRPVHRSTFSRR